MPSLSSWRRTTKPSNGDLWHSSRLQLCGVDSLVGVSRKRHTNFKIITLDHMKKMKNNEQHLEEQASNWTHIWNRPHPGDAAGTLHTPWQPAKHHHTQLLQPWLPPPNTTQPTLQVTTKQLIQAARRSRGKAAGGDGWQSEHFLALPNTWWDCFRDLWHTILDTAHIPPSWLQTLVVLLPKPTGGTRPISITGIAWRIAASATVRALAPWTHDWAAPALCGGLPGRDGIALHVRLFHDLLEHHDEDFIVLSQDLSKAFDTVHIMQALTALSHYGAPDSLCQTILAFYQGCRRLFLYNGTMSPTWQATTHGILQGCPFSPLLLATLMNIWHHGIHTLTAPATTVHTGIYVDDRNIWMHGPSTRELLPQILARSRAIDDILGFQENTSKTQLATPNEQLLPVLDSLTPNNFPPAGATSTLLGLVYNLRTKEVTTPTATTDKFIHRAKRIQQATRFFHHRRRLLRTTAIPCLTWAGPLAFFTPTQQRQLRLHALHALRGWIPQTASRHNIWTSKLQPHDDPAYCLHEAHLRLPTWYSRLQITTHPWLQHIRHCLQQPQQPQHLRNIPALQNTLHTPLVEVASAQPHPMQNRQQRTHPHTSTWLGWQHATTTMAFPPLGPQTFPNGGTCLETTEAQ